MLQANESLMVTARVYCFHWIYNDWYCNRFIYKHNYYRSFISSGLYQFGTCPLYFGSDISYLLLSFFFVQFSIVSVWWFILKLDSIFYCFVQFRNNATLLGKYIVSVTITFAMMLMQTSTSSWFDLHSELQWFPRLFCSRLSCHLMCNHPNVLYLNIVNGIDHIVL